VPRNAIFICLLDDEGYEFDCGAFWGQKVEAAFGAASNIEN
jgi:hypothetical protein